MSELKRSMEIVNFEALEPDCRVRFASDQGNFNSRRRRAVDESGTGGMVIVFIVYLEECCHGI